MKFTKMHGAGNDYIYLDGFRDPVATDLDRLAVALSDRHFGVGGDGLVVIEPSKNASVDAKMRMFNVDGSESEMCGNAIRCVGKYLYDHGICRKESLFIETGAGIKQLLLFVREEDEKVDRVRVDMGEPILKPELIPTVLRSKLGDEEPLVGFPFPISDSSARELMEKNYICVNCVSMGNPHCVTFDLEPTDEVINRLGPIIENDPRFPRRVNVGFAEILSRQELRLRVWERGSGETLACGTGACACCVAAVLSGRTDRKILIHLSGGDLEIEWSQADNHVYQTGPAVEVFHGEV